MAKYRPIDLRLWSDRKFLALGDDARLLWMFLLTTPATLPIPGVIVAGEAALAEQLGWTVERFTERFRELAQSGLAVRREGRVWWLQNALRYQQPANPNTVKCWAKSWDDVPEGELKVEIWEALRIACKSWSRLFEKLFPNGTVHGTVPQTVNSSPNGSLNGSTQEQEQEQKQEQKDLPRHSPLPKTSLSRPLGEASYDPEDPAAIGRLGREIYARLSRARVDVGRELGENLAPFPPCDVPSSRSLGYRSAKDRVREEGSDAPFVCHAVLDVLIADAREKRDVEWLAEKAFDEKPWRNARNRIGRRRGPRSAEQDMPSLARTGSDDEPDFGVLA